MLYLRKAPYYQLDKVRTPTILHHGTIDFQCLRRRAGCIFRALQQLGKLVEVQFILYPDETSRIAEADISERKLEEDRRGLTSTSSKEVLKTVC